MPGAVPATIAIINGFPKIGLTPSELKMLAEPASELKAPVIKASRRDVAYACAHRLNAGKVTIVWLRLVIRCFYIILVVCYHFSGLYLLRQYAILRCMVM
jgi:pseudouridine-5'-phosphate glycosidase